MYDKNTLRLSAIRKMPRVDRPRKYRILDIVMSKPASQYKFYLKAIAEKIGVTSKHLQAKMAYRIGDPLSFNGDQLEKIARLLNVTVNDLYQNTYEIIDDINPPVQLEEEIEAALQKTTI